MNMKKYFELGMLKLLEQKSIDEITVSELIEEVGSCKGTFYKHYVDKYDLCCKCIKNHYYGKIPNNMENWEEFVMQSLVVFEGAPKVIVHAFKSVDVNSVRRYHESLVRETLTRQFINSGGDISSEINVASISLWATSVTDITYNWLKDGRPQTKEEIITLLRAVMPQVIYSEFGKI